MLSVESCRFSNEGTLKVKYGTNFKSKSDSLKRSIIYSLPETLFSLKWAARAANAPSGQGQ
jgi:hypothetical protein